MSKMIAAMVNELTSVRAWLLTQKGNWSSIASRAHVSTKTIQRIAKDPQRYVSLRTLERLRTDMNEGQSAAASSKEAA
jgi:hypothetical protein